MLWKRSLALLAVLLLMSVTAGPAAAAKSYTADSYDVTVRIEDRGDLMVVETVRFRFEGGPFTYVFRNLEYANLDEIEVIEASLDGRALAQGAQPGQVEIQPGRSLKVTWHFAPISDAAHEFRLAYRVRGALRQDAGADTLDWIALPTERDYPIAHSTLRLEYPPGKAPLDAPTLEGAPARLEAGGQAAMFILQNLDPDTTLRLTARFPAGSLIAGAPGWQAQRAERDRQIGAATPYGLGAALLTALVGFAGMALAGLRFRREALPASDTTQRYASPPRNIAPALAGRLTGSSTGFLGTLFDLARRGVVLIEEGPKQWGSRVFYVARLTHAEMLSAHEKAFMQAFFSKAKDERVPLANVGSLVYNSAYARALDDELDAAGWRDPERYAQRGRFILLGFLALAAGGIALTPGLLVFTGALPALPMPVGLALLGAGAALSVVALLGLMIAAFISPFSDEGLRQAETWKSFDRYLRDVAGGREPAVSPETFESYLPFSAAFGHAAEWARHFAKEKDTPVPDWLRQLQPGMDDGSFVVVMAAISAADTSAAASISDGGASGGGSSGAG